MHCIDPNSEVLSRLLTLYHISLNHIQYSWQARVLLFVLCQLSMWTCGNTCALDYQIVLIYYSQKTQHHAMPAAATTFAIHFAPSSARSLHARTSQLPMHERERALHFHLLGRAKAHYAMLRRRTLVTLHGTLVEKLNRIRANFEIETYRWVRSCKAARCR